MLFKFSLKGIYSEARSDQAVESPIQFLKAGVSGKWVWPNELGGAFYTMSAT